MTESELLEWAKACVAAWERIQAARANVHSGKFDAESKAEFNAAREAWWKAGEVDIADIAEAIIEHFGKPARHFGRTRFDAPKEVL